MGTKYIRENQLPSEIKLIFSDKVIEINILVKHIINDPDKPLGNVLTIHVRQEEAESKLSFIEIARTEDESILTVKKSLALPGTHQLIIESYDENSTVKSTLKTDIISLVIELEDSIEKIAPYYNQTPLETYFLKVGDYEEISFGTIMFENDEIELDEAEEVSNIIQLVTEETVEEIAIVVLRVND